MSENLSLDFDANETTASPKGPVTCLGLTFENDQARRAHLTEELRKKLEYKGFRTHAPGQGQCIHGMRT